MMQRVWTRDRTGHKFGHCAAFMWNSNEKIYHTDQKCSFLFTAVHCLAIISKTQGKTVP